MPSSPAPVLDEIRSVPQRGSRTGRSTSKAMPAPPPALSIRIPVRLAGFVLLGVVGVCLAALASWSVDDPSFTYATSKTPANWLGFPGAVIADTLFQVFGLAALVLLVPPALWAWAFVRRCMPSRMGLRVLGWLGGTVLTAGALAFIAMPETWPLPTGLGGLVGVGFSSLAAMIAGSEPQAITTILFAIILA
ncbi:MAG TPA: DNA translocase FtsK 4TM domain-containing protein, partial [Devosia sp.]|nr:DNA translocase FtsK 4TM domain-containing protein [Devosia sp.]